MWHDENRRTDVDPPPLPLSPLPPTYNVPETVSLDPEIKMLILPLCVAFSPEVTSAGMRDIT